MAEQDVHGLNIAMDDPDYMGCCEATADAEGDIADKKAAKFNQLGRFCPQE